MRNVTLKLGKHAPFTLVGYAKKYSPSYTETHFTITQNETGFTMESTENTEYTASFKTLEDAISQADFLWT